VRLSTLGSRDRRALLLGGPVLLTGLCWMLVVSPYARAVREVSDRLTAERELLAREFGLLANAGAFQAAIDSGSARLIEAAPRLFGGESEAMAGAALARYLESGATESKAVLARLEPGPARVVGVGIKALPAHAQGETDLWGLLLLLYSLEAGQKMVRIEGLRIRSQRGRAVRSQDYEALSFEFTVTGYMLEAAFDTLSSHAALPGDDT